MEEQFILRVPPSLAGRIEDLLNSENSSSSEDKSLDLSVVESYKTYDDSVLIKTADVGQMIMVRENEGDSVPPGVVEYRHGLTHPTRDARRGRFRREPDLIPEVVRRVEKDLLEEDLREMCLSESLDGIVIDLAVTILDGNLQFCTSLNVVRTFYT
ncbi:hypothetical protein RJ639_002539 [Escallonia herrerae]|uniref:TAFII55 protein conserved region domain-containing protein n=1 Tax=Escallonia herrerae TaxID=1293975 RepID=A0AA88XAS9_9ASTE|nr:hypothetical protein RJ639_002539 [Escallonia herrerae]